MLQGLKCQWRRYRRGGWLIVCVGSLCNPAAIRAEPTSLDLLQGVYGMSYYAADQYRCLGYSKREAHDRAQAALGRNFHTRLQRVTQQLVDRYGEDAVNERTELVAIGFKTTPERCRQVRRLVERARADLATLEQKVGN